MNILHLIFIVLVIGSCFAQATKLERYENVINLKNQSLTDLTIFEKKLKSNLTTTKILPPRSKVNAAENPIKSLNITSNNLEELNVTHCLLTYIYIVSDNLKVLHLDYNFLEVLSSDMIISSHLEQLTLSNNFIFAIRRGTFSRLTALKVIDLSNNRIISLDDDSFAGNLLLDKINLRHNKIVTLDLTFYGSTLLLSNNKLANSNDQLITQMPYITTLDISYNGLTSIPELRSVTLLHYELRGNNITEATSLTTFEHLPLLEYLDLRDNQFVLIFHPKIFMFNNIKQLRLDGNPWKCKCDRSSYKFYKFLEGPPQKVQTFDVLKCEGNGKEWDKECHRRWMRFKQLTEPMQKFAYGCFAFILGT